MPDSVIKVDNLSGLTSPGVGLQDGSVSSPALKFSNDGDTGLYRIGSNTIGIASNGTRVGEIGNGYGGFTGNVIQLQNSVNSFSQTNTTAGSYSDVNSSTGVIWETTITPRYSNSKIIVMYSINFFISATGTATYGGFAFARKIGLGTYTTIYDSQRDSNGPYTYGISNGTYPNAFYNQGFLIHVDLPATTSTCTYKIMSRPYASGYTLGLNIAGGQFTGSSYCLLQEVQQ